MSDDNNTALAAPPGPLDVLQSMGGEFMDALAHPGHEGDYDEAETSSEEEDMAVPAPLTKLAASDMSWPWSHKPTEHEKEEREKRAGKWGMGDPLQDGTEELGINWPWKKKDKEYEAEKAEAKARRARRDLEHARTKNREPLGNELQDDLEQYDKDLERQLQEGGSTELGINWPWTKKDKEYELEKAEAKARRAKRDLEHARTKNREPAPVGLADMPALQKNLSTAEVTFANIIDHVMTRQQSLASVQAALVKSASGVALFDATLAAATALAEMRAHAEDTLGRPVKPLADQHLGAQRPLVGTKEAEAMAESIVAFAQSLEAGTAAARGKALAFYLRGTTTPSLLPNMVASLAEAVLALQNAATGGTVPRDAAVRMKQFWASSGSAADLHAAVQQCFA